MVSELPAGWATAHLEDCADVLDSLRQPINSEERKRRIDGKKGVDLFPYYGATGQVGLIDDFIFDEELVALGEDGAPFLDPGKMKAYMIRGKTWVNNHAHVLRGMADMLDNRILCHFLNQFDYRSYVNGGTRLKLTQANMRKIPLRIPPLEEQKRIAQKLDVLLGQVDTLKTRIDAIPALLKRFRQAILRDAVEDNLVIGRRGSTEWTNWPSVRAEDVCNKVQSGGTPKGGFITDGVPFLKVYNLVNGAVDFDYRPQYIASDVHNGTCKKSITRPGDVLMNIVGPPLGKIAVVPSSHSEWNINQAITLFRPSERITSDWIHLVLLEGTNIRNVSQLTKGSAGQVNISLSQCRDFVFPVPPVEFQNLICERVGKLLAFADQLEARVSAAQERIDSLTQSLLAKGFRGELVPQDPNDEPASVLLERIRAQRAATHKPKRGRKATVN